MPGPQRIEDLLAAREARVEALEAAAAEAFASLSDGELQTTSINELPRPEVFTVVCWNVQTFEAGKSLGNPFVNRVINRVLSALDADVCVLLETRADSYVNMNAIETGHAGEGGWVQAGSDDEDLAAVAEPDETHAEPTDEGTWADEPAGMSASDSLHGGDPLVYNQVVSGMTGKLWKPPKKIYVYHAAQAAAWRALVDLDDRRRLEQKSARARLTKKEQKRLEKLVARPPDVPANVHPAELAVAKRYVFFPKFLKRHCVSEPDDAPSDAWKHLVADAECAPLRRYYDLCRLDDELREEPASDYADALAHAPSENWRFVFRLRTCVCGEDLGSGDCAACEELGAYSTELANLRATIDVLTFYRCTAEESYSILVRPSTRLVGPSAGGTWLRGKCARVLEIGGRLLMHAPDVDADPPSAKAGRLLGYQDGRMAFYGRCPFLLPVSLWLPYTGERLAVPLIAFHGPFGKSTNAGVEARAGALRELLRAEVLPDVALGDAPHAIVLGDFNLDWSPETSASRGPEVIANEVFANLMENGLTPMIEGGIATSLVSIHGSAAWQELGDETAAYTSSAYDQCFVKAPADVPGLHACTVAAVVDVVAWIRAHLDEFSLPDDDPIGDRFAELSETARAFYIYHKYVSDHLPIVCEILVGGMPEDSEAFAAAANDARRYALAMRPVLSAFEAVFEYEAVEHIERVDEGQEVAPDQFVVESRDGKARRVLVVGVIETYATSTDSGTSETCMVVRTAPLAERPAHSALFPYRVPAASVAEFESEWGVGTRVRLRLLNPRPVELRAQ